MKSILMSLNVLTPSSFSLFSDGRGLDQRSLQSLCNEASTHTGGSLISVGPLEAALLVAAMDSDMDGKLTLADIMQVWGV